MNERSIALEKIKRYCRVISKSDLGYGNLGGLLVLDHNTPNTTLPIIWARGKSWMPLFPRATRIRGAAKVQKIAEAELSQETKAQAGETVTVQPKDVDLTLFVEGRLDELFVDYLRKHQDLAARIGVASVDAIALGGLYQSERLLNLLRTTKKHAIFVLDADEQTQRIVLRSDGFTSISVVYLKPSFTALLDMNRLYAARDRFPHLPDKSALPSEIAWFHEVERAVLKRGPVSANSERIIQIIDEFLDPERYNEFALELAARATLLLRNTLGLSSNTDVPR